MFADQKILPNGFCMEFAGVVRARSQTILDENLYCMRFPLSLPWNRKFTIDAKEKGNFSRFINHSDFPNLELRPVIYQGMVRMLLIAIKTIEKGDQLTFDYGKEYWKKIAKTPEPL